MHPRLFLAIPLALLAGGCGMRALIYPAPPVPVPSPPPAPLVEVELALANGGHAVAWWQESSSAPATAPIVLFFHGNGENLETMRRAGTFDRLAGLGAAVLAVDYPGYGRSGGDPSEASLLAVADRAVDWVRERQAGRRLILCGWSLGASLAIQTAARRPADIAGLAAWSPWTSLPAVARQHYPAWMVSALLDDRYDSSSAAGGVRAPTSIVHGADDDLIPVAHGRQLGESIPGARFVGVAGAGHNDLLEHAEPWRELAALVERVDRRAQTGNAAAAPGATD